MYAPLGEASGSPYAIRQRVSEPIQLEPRLTKAITVSFRTFDRVAPGTSLLTSPYVRPGVPRRLRSGQHRLYRDCRILPPPHPIAGIPPAIEGSRGSSNLRAGAGDRPGDRVCRSCEGIVDPTRHLAVSPLHPESSRSAISRGEDWHWRAGRSFSRSCLCSLSRSSSCRCSGFARPPKPNHSTELLCRRGQPARQQARRNDQRPGHRDQPVHVGRCMIPQAACAPSPLDLKNTIKDEIHLGF
jgi:hypothetical protein